MKSLPMLAVLYAPVATTLPSSFSFEIKPEGRRVAALVEADCAGFKKGKHHEMEWFFGTTPGPVGSTTFGGDRREPVGCGRDLLIKAG